MKSARQIKKFLSNGHFLAGTIVIVVVILGITTLVQNKSLLSAQSQIKTASTSESDHRQQINNSQTATVGKHTTTTGESSKKPTKATTSKSEVNQDDKPPQTTNPRNLFTSLSLSAESVVVWNQAENEIIYEQQSRKEQPLASLTKLMTALVAAENTTASTTAVVNSQHLNATGEYGLAEGEKWPIDQLITFMLVRSANDAARAVASATVNAGNDGYASEFVDLMNQTANRLGLGDTYFFNPSGLDINEELISGGYGTAYDTVKLFDYITSNYPKLLEPTTKATVQVHTDSGHQYVAENTNQDISKYSNSYGSKTGYTVLAGGNLIMGFQLEEPVIIAVFGSTKQGRFEDMQQLYQATKRYISVTDID